MAIGTLTPKIRACFEGCSKIKVYDTTGAESTANTGGWGVTNDIPANITAATITYTTPSNSTATSVNVLTNVNAQAVVSGEFLLAEIDITAEDGSYIFKYTLTNNTNSVTRDLEIFSLCVVRCCIDKLWAKVAANALGEDCKCTGEKTTALEKAELAEGWYNAIRFGAACNSTTIKNELLKKLQRICKLENCNCK